MNTGQSTGTQNGRFGCRLIVFCGLAVVTAISSRVPFLLFAADVTQRELPPNTLWEVVHNVCVPGQSEHHDPRPCLHVDLSSGIESGFAILQDPRGGTQFLLVPTTRISGIESPTIRGPSALNYFAIAWEARTYINKSLHLTLPRDAVGLAINSAQSRTQDQMHIHISCIRNDVSKALHKNEEKIGNRWEPLNDLFVGHNYMAMWVAGEHLDLSNPFRILAAELPGASRDMANRSLVVIGFTRAGGTKGFVILAGQVYKNRDLGNGEELLDNSCHIAAIQH
jgi:CDP-diacylglycerol pyrophosphatase